jgi:methylmalonyl-CoA mutase N-terminal domain/subunit
VRPFTVGPDVLERQLARLAHVRATRDDAAVTAALARVRMVATHPDTNIMPSMLDAVRAYATVGEISAALEAVFGRHRPVGVI